MHWAPHPQPLPSGSTPWPPRPFPSTLPALASRITCPSSGSCLSCPWTQQVQGPQGLTLSCHQGVPVGAARRRGARNAAEGSERPLSPVTPERDMTSPRSCFLGHQRDRRPVVQDSCGRGGAAPPGAPQPIGTGHLPSASTPCVACRKGLSPRPAGSTLRTRKSGCLSTRWGHRARLRKGPGPGWGWGDS